MADITMCTGTKCPLKEKCYRYTAPISEFRQAYFANPSVPYNKSTKKCEYYWDNINYKKI